ncbi:MAG: methylenetetrahydrofolate reductase [Proteobacteria bacterium]|nr:methylenetetrahydrofolate reductase [Pseudomonadota bacterium]
MTRIIEKVRSALDKHSSCFSFEYYPPKDRGNWPVFFQKVERMSLLLPQFIDVTWGTGSPTSLASLEVARDIQAHTGIDTMMHLTCTHRSKAQLMDILREVHDRTGLRNLMALRGNRPKEGVWQPHPEGFVCAAELVRAIRDAYGDAFCISVAGYPEGHHEFGAPSPDFAGSPEYFRQIGHLREKVEAGADFIVTQLCYDLDQICRFRDDCEANGIHCPIVPGILPVHSAQTWEKIAAFSATIPKPLAEDYARVAPQDEVAFDAFAVRLLSGQIEFVHAHGFWAVHLYTLNHEKLISRVLKG